MEWLDVEACLPEETLTSICNLVNTKYKDTCRILGSLHRTTPQSNEQLEEMFSLCSLSGRADMLKVVSGATEASHCIEVVFIHFLYDSLQIISTGRGSG